MNRHTKNGDSKTIRKSSLFIQQGGTCIYCDKRFYKLDELTLEHIVPGFNHPMNYSLSCVVCNQLKTNMYLMDNPKITSRMSEEFLHRILVMQLYILNTFINPLLGN